MLPSFISDSTEFAKQVIFGDTTESLVLEFKESVPLPPKGTPENVRREAQKELCRDIAQFANTNGGTLLIGIESGPGPSGMKVAKGVMPVQDVEGLRQRIEDAIAAYLVPSTFSHPIVPVNLVGNTILAINVPAHRDLVALWDRQAHTIEYVYRTSHGKEWLNPDEVERQRMNTSRAGRLAILQAKKDQRSEQIEVVGGFRNRAGSPPDGRWQAASAVFGPIGEHTFELRLSSDGKTHTVALPFSFVENAWVGSDGKVNLLLSVCIVRVNTSPPQAYLILERAVQPLAL